MRRRLALPQRIGHWSLTSLQQRLVKTGGRVLGFESVLEWHMRPTTLSAPRSIAHDDHVPAIAVSAPDLSRDTTQLGDSQRRGAGHSGEGLSIRVEVHERVVAAPRRAQDVVAQPDMITAIHIYTVGPRLLAGELT